MLGRLLQDKRLTALWHYLEFLPGVYPVTNALTLSIYYYNNTSLICTFFVIIYYTEINYLDLKTHYCYFPKVHSV